MPTSLTEFTDATAFERYVLDRATPLLPRAPGTSVIELGDDDTTSVAVGAQPATVHVGVSDSAGSAAAQLSADDIRPLLFGAAWKVLDQLTEFALEAATVPHDRGRHYTIAFKVGEAANGRVPPVTPLDRRSDLWVTAMETYASADVLRNSIAHRQLRVDHSNGTINGVPEPGEPAPTPFTLGEQSAFCQAAAGIAEAVINVELPTRRADQLSWALDQLASHHHQLLSGVAAAHGVVPAVIVRPTPRPSGEFTLDFASITRRARAAVGGVSHYDLHIHLPDGRVLAGPLEDAPLGEAAIALAGPPAWLRWI